MADERRVRAEVSALRRLATRHRVRPCRVRAGPRRADERAAPWPQQVYHDRKVAALRALLPPPSPRDTPTDRAAFGEDAFVGEHPEHNTLHVLARLLERQGWRIDALGQESPGSWRIEGAREGAALRLAAPSVPALADRVLATLGRLPGPTAACPACGKPTVVLGEFGLGVRCVRGCALTRGQRAALRNVLDPPVPGDGARDWDA